DAGPPLREEKMSRKDDEDELLDEDARGAVVGLNWWEGFYNPAAWWADPAMAMYSGSQPSYAYRPSSFDSGYWSAQRAANPSASAAQQRAGASRSLQQALRAEQMARIAAMQSQIAPQPSAPVMSQPAPLPSMSPDTSDATTEDGGTIMGFIDDVLGAILP